MLLTEVKTCQVSAVFCYIDMSQAIHERFIGFSHFNEDGTANTLLSHVCNGLTEYLCEEKLIGQTYDIVDIISNEFHGLQTLVKSRSTKQY